MARFYGWTDDEIQFLDVDKYIMYRKGMHILRAQEDLMNLKISCAPEMEEQAREKLFNYLHARAFPVEAVEMTAENLARLLNG